MTAEAPITYDTIDAATWRPFLTVLPPATQVLELVAPGIDGDSPLHAAAAGLDCRIHAITVDALSSPATPPKSFNAAGGEFVLRATNARDVFAALWPALQPGSEAEFLFHHADSIDIHRARMLSSEADIVFGRDGVFTQLRRLFSLTGGASREVEAAGNALQQSVARLRQLQAKLADHGRGELIASALDATRHVMEARRQGDTPEVSEMLDAAEQGIRQYADYLSAMPELALDAAAMDHTAQQARGVGFTRVEFQPAEVAGHLRGWRLLMHRP